jgi:hypothetical protein
VPCSSTKPIFPTTATTSGVTAKATIQGVGPIVIPTITIPSVVNR